MGNKVSTPPLERMNGSSSWIRKALPGLYLVFWLTTPMTGLQAQSIRKPIRVLTTKDGLPQSFVSGLVQDSTGFVWIGTRNGLARYDGRQFVAFHYKQDDSTTLSSDVIISLVNDARGHVWIENESGEIDRLTPRTQRIDRISLRPLFRRHPVRFARRGWTIDRQDKLWGTSLRGGVWCYDWAHQTIHHYTKQRHGLPSDTIRGVLASRNGPIWFISRQALSRLDPTTGKIQPVALPTPMEHEDLPIAAGGIIRLHERRNGELMWAYKGQVVVFSPTTGQFRPVPLPVAAGLCWFTTGPDGQDYLTTGGRVYRYHPDRGLVLLGELAVASGVESLLVDRSGLIWVGTNAAGIHQIDESALFFEPHTNQAGFHEDLFRQAFGPSIVHTFTWPTTDGAIRLASYSLRSTYDARNRLWVGLRYRVGYYDSTRRQLALLPIIPTYQASAGRQWGVGGLRFDAAGTLWIVDTDGYVATFDTLRQRWIPWMSADQLRQANGFKVFTGDLMVDDRAVWITTHEHGLIRIDRTTRRTQVITRTTSSAHFPSNLLLGMQSDPTRADRLWIGSHAGLIGLNKTTLQGQTFTIADGLPDNTIYSVLADRRGFLWLTTNQGLCRFDPLTHQVRTFTTTDGLPGDEFNRFHHLRLPDGRFAFGGTDGWILFDPLAIQDDRFRPAVALTELKINNQAIPITPGREPLPVPINELTELVVPFVRNTLSLSFAGLEYNQPARLRYRYQLEGYDENWVDADLTPLASYTQLPPGHYTLRVNATNTTGQWSIHEHTLAITVTPPWWRTWWAYGFYALLGFILLHVYSRLRAQQEREHQLRLVEEQKATQLQEVDELKTRFFANITHEFRTPLTLILSPVEALLSELKQTRYGGRLALVDRNARQLLGLINQLMDLAKLDARLMPVTPVRGRPDEVVAGLVQSFAEAAKASSIRLVFQADGAGLYWFDSDKLERIVTNLLANALKFTPGTAAHPGTVTVTLHTGDVFRLSVADTGIGISADQLPHLFNRFYQVGDTAIRPSLRRTGSVSDLAFRPGRAAQGHERPPGRRSDYEEPNNGHARSVDTMASHQPPGTGIGLALVKELVDLQGGQIRVESQPGQGTTFWVDLPYQPLADSQPVVTAPAALTPVSQPIDQDESDRYRTGMPDHGAPAEATVLLLLVEDNDDMAQFITESLPPHYTVHRAVDGLDGQEQAGRLMPDVIISDVMMPRMDGYELCRRLKTDSLTDHIPVLLLTAKVALESRMQGLSLGADDYLDKPFHLPELLLRVNNLLTTQRRQRERLRAELASPLSATLAAPAHPFLEKLHRALDKQLDVPSFGVDDLAAEASLSRMQLHRKLKVLTGLSTTEFIRTYRLQRSVPLLAGGLSVTQTAYAVGFDNPSYFGQCFRELFGQPPSGFIPHSSQP